jgi:hypothetical protein
MIEIQNKLNSEKYKNHYTQNELIEINKIFSMFDNIEESIKEIELNKNNFSINISNNLCILTIKIDTNELPKNKISDTIIFKIPLIELKLEKNNSYMNQINKNLKCLKIENNISIESINNASPCSSIKFNNSTNSDNVVLNLMTKVDKLCQENKEIKERLRVLEENNNKLINIIKENRINLLKEKNNLDSSSLNISHNNKNVESENIQNNNNNQIFDTNVLSFCALQDNENEQSSNFLTRMHEKHLKEKIKNRNDLLDDIKANKMDVESHEEKNKLFFNSGRDIKNNININNKNDIMNENNLKEEDDEDNYLYNNKNDTEIIDDINLFSNNGIKKKNENNKINKFYGNNYDINKNVMCVDENEEEKIKNNIINHEDDEEDCDVNKSYNLVGGVCLPISRKSSFSSNHSHRKSKKKVENNPSAFSSGNQLNLKKNDMNRMNDNLF